MDNQNIKTYLIVAGIVVFIFLFLLIIPFSRLKKTTNNSDQDITIPTGVQIDNKGQNIESTTEISNFTGVAEEELPQPIYDAAIQKQTLRRLVPITLASFSINFDYGEDKFIISLSEPKDQSRQEFNKWRNDNYPAIEENQFNFQ